MQTLKTTPPPPKWQPQPLDLLEVPKADHLSAQSLHLADFINTSLDLRHLTLPTAFASSSSSFISRSSTFFTPMDVVEWLKRSLVGVILENDKRFTTGFHQMLLRIDFVGWFGSSPSLSNYSSNNNRLNVRRSSMTNSLMRIAGIHNN
ncbi:hypothetical protein H0E87_000671 [Populus deltoides]|uniref:Uncharacterized protein n=1 Tax=Populus deltoides TaxID=3696 RepID=A0A8T2ZMS5_POPDE|nr:hypothetical protein H0E87_000671 [Populus deltoides]